MNAEKIQNMTAVLAAQLTVIEQIEVAEAILAKHDSMQLTLTKRDATMRIADCYAVNNTEAQQLAEEFFSSELWREKRRSEEEYYWDACGAEVLFSPLDDWMDDKGLKKSFR